jgi:hypothetical protein
MEPEVSSTRDSTIGLNISVSSAKDFKALVADSILDLS